MSPPITIAIPFYEGLDYLAAAVESVLAQSDPDWQLLVCDDGEQEQGAGELVDSFGDPRIHYRRNPRNLGMVPNWNACIERAETDLVTLLHADDLLLPSYTTLMQELAGRYPKAAAFFCGARIIDARGRRGLSVADTAKRLFVPRGRGPLVLRSEPALHALMRGNFIFCPTLCFRRSALGERRFSERWRQVQDLELSARLLCEGETLVGSREPGYAYRRHAESATALHNESMLRFEEELVLFDEIAERAQQLGWERAARASRRKTIVKLHLAYRVVRDLLTLQPGRALDKLRFLVGSR